MEREVKIELVDDLGMIWKRWSVKIIVIQGAVAATYGALHIAGLAPELPDWLLLAGFLLFSAAASTVALLKQSNLPPAQ